MNSIKIGIITTVYKAENDLPRLLESMIAQKCKNLVFYLIDNGSPDKCGEICDEFARRDNRFVVCHLDENIGYVGARNYGLRHCNTDYISFCDSDDYLEPGGYDNAYNDIISSDCDFWLGAYNNISSNAKKLFFPPFNEGVYIDNEIRVKIEPSLYGLNEKYEKFHGFVWKNIYKKSIISDNEISFLEYLKPYEDEIFNIYFIKKCNKVCVSKNVVYNYIVNTDSITAKMSTDFDANKEWDLYTKLFKLKSQTIDNDALKMKLLFNDMYSKLYYISLSLCKYVGCSIKHKSSNLKKICNSNIGRSILSQPIELKSPILRFTRFCLKNHFYLLLIFVITCTLKLRKVL